MAFGRTYLVALNLTESLPGTFFLVEKVSCRNVESWSLSDGSLTGRIPTGVSLSKSWSDCQDQLLRQMAETFSWMAIQSVMRRKKPEPERY